MCTTFVTGDVLRACAGQTKDLASPQFLRTATVMTVEYVTHVNSVLHCAGLGKEMAVGDG
jgi:hypothetical protein